MDIVHLIVSFILTLVALWDIADHRRSRVHRLLIGLIGAGALANVVGLCGALLGVRGYTYEHVWPGECVVGLGVALLLLVWPRTSPSRGVEDNAHG